MKEKLKMLSLAYNDKKAKIIKKIEKPVSFLKLLFGWAIMICLFAGAATALGFLFALIAGGEIAVSITAFIGDHVIPAVTYASTVSVLFGIILMYLSGQSALSAKKKPAPRPEAKESTAKPEA